MFDLSAKTVLVTGAGGYLGSAIAHGLARAGATVLLVGRDEARLAAVRGSLADPAHCHSRAADLADPDAIARLVEWVEDRFGVLHGLVNNAYGGRVGPIDRIEEVDFASATTLNLVAPFLLSRRLAPLMAASANGASSAIVNVASMYGKVSPDPRVYHDRSTTNPAQYGATKAGLIQLTRYLACHLDPARIRVNSVSPGPFPDPVTNPDPTFAARLAEKSPMGRIGTAAEIAGPVIFLVSDAASYVNGADLAVDGGWTSW